MSIPADIGCDAKGETPYDTESQFRPLVLPWSKSISGTVGIIYGGVGTFSTCGG